MRSFKIEKVDDFTSDGFDWFDCHALTCRPCETGAASDEECSFVPDVAIKVGQKLHCPFCGEPSIVPKKARW